MSLALVFQLNGRDYGLEIEAIREIVEAPQRYPVPLTGPCLEGAINAHGEILPVIDLPALIGARGAVRDTRMLLLSPEYRSLALIVERVDGIVPLDLDACLPGVDAAPCCRGRVEREDGPPVCLLDLEGIYLQLEELFNDNGGALCPCE